MRLIVIELDKLRNHPLNAKVFGQLSCESDSESFHESVQRWGVQIPLHVAPAREDGSYLILSGHRRRQAAAKAGMKEVPCIVRDDANSPEMVDLIWSESNLQREMTTDQRARFFESRAAIEVALAKQRQGNERGVREIPVSEKGEAKDKAAKAAGLSRKTAEKAVAVTHRIDELEQQGKQQDAAKLRETLNSKSVAAAHREATGEPEKPADDPPSDGKPDGLTLTKHVMAVRAAGKAAESWTDSFSQLQVFDEMRKWTARHGVEKPPPEKPKANGRFKPPTQDEVAAYVTEKDWAHLVDAEDFIAHYSANGWRTGKGGIPMKDWRAAVLTWVKMRKKEGGKNGRAIPDDYGKAGVLS